jgi:hypothetical protein
MLIVLYERRFSSRAFRSDRWDSGDESYLYLQILFTNLKKVRFFCTGFMHGTPAHIPVAWRSLAPTKTSTLLTGHRCLFLCLFVCLFVLVSKRYEKRYLVCLSPNCQKGYWSVCHPTFRKDTGLSVTGAREKIPGLSDTHGLFVVDIYPSSFQRSDKKSLLT